MNKFLMILAGSVLLTTSALASGSRGNRDYLPPGYCMKNNCTFHETLSGVQTAHTHALKARKLSKLDLEERRLWERGSRGSVRQ